ncbi:hypothetical protein D9757_006419 [Collybiopsis confluens]|uniref:Uncharacterized protein n=1 Tax=Collybiopsis confluens TaxID=2823264 RepID=A0A8H5HK56_9AGAR|nr:hypothetical protein D9757_006419 [Collybiopsis confluens]
MANVMEASDSKIWKFGVDDWDIGIGSARSHGTRKRIGAEPLPQSGTITVDLYSFAKITSRLKWELLFKRVKSLPMPVGLLVIRPNGPTLEQRNCGITLEREMLESISLPRTTSRGATAADSAENWLAFHIFSESIETVNR